MLHGHSSGFDTKPHKAEKNKNKYNNCCAAAVMRGAAVVAVVSVI
jgi:hypothetical protein